MSAYYIRGIRSSQWWRGVKGISAGKRTMGETKRTRIRKDISQSNPHQNIKIDFANRNVTQEFANDSKNNSHRYFNHECTIRFQKHIRKEFPQRIFAKEFARIFTKVYATKNHKEISQNKK